MKLKNLLLILLIILIPISSSIPIYAADTSLIVSYIDVGQADSILIQQGNKSMLIDAGNYEDGDAIIKYIKRKGIKRLDCVVGTHPHEDHIGSLSKIIDTFVIGTIYMPKVATNTKTFENTLLSIKKKGLKIKEARAGVSIDFGKTKTSIIAPVSPKYEDLNNYSAVIKMTYGKNSFLFMGDAETLSEKEILKDVRKNFKTKVDVIKIGHHASGSSSSWPFLKAVLSDNSYAIISVGKNNDYGHPHAETIAKLRKIGAKILRTDELGTIVIKSDGKTIAYNKMSSVKTTPAPANEAGKYIGNKNSKKFHKSTCKSLPIEKNKVLFDSREEAIKQSYEPCGVCNP